MITLAFAFQPQPADQQTTPDVGGLRFQLRRLEERVQQNADQAHENRVSAEARFTKLETQNENNQKLLWLIVGALVVETVKRVYSFVAARTRNERL